MAERGIWIYTFLTQLLDLAKYQLQAPLTLHVISVEKKFFGIPQFVKILWRKVKFILSAGNGTKTLDNLAQTMTRSHNAF